MSGKRTLRRGLYLALGYFGLAMGAVGAAVPLLPAFPFLALAAWGFAKGDERVHRWFVGTRFYKDNLHDFLSGRGMTKAAKVRVMLSVTAVMAVGAYFMRRVPVGQIILFFVWVGHILLFTFGIRTVSEPLPPAETGSPNDSPQP